MAEMINVKPKDNDGKAPLHFISTESYNVYRIRTDKNKKFILLQCKRYMFTSLIFLIFNVICLEFGIKKSKIEKLYKDK